MESASAVDMARSATVAGHPQRKCERQPIRKMATMPAFPSHRQKTHVNLVSDLVPLEGVTGAKSIVDHVVSVSNVRKMLVRAQLPIRKAKSEKAWKRLALLSILLNVASVPPYVRIIAQDARSPIFLAFARHVFTVAISLPVAGRLVKGLTIPIRYHAGCVFLSFLFNYLKSDAFARLPTPIAMLLMNLQMLVGMIVQSTVFGQQFSVAQISGCLVVTLGVGVAGNSSRGEADPGEEEVSSLQYFIGCSELLGGLVALVLLGALVKMAFSAHGPHVDEQIFVQNILSVPLFMVGGQWDLIGPKLGQWYDDGAMILVLLLVGNLALTYVGNKARVLFASRAPNVLLVQLIETLTRFVSLLATVFINAPPFPTAGFWLGSVVLTLGTLQFLTASAPPPVDDGSSESSKED